MAVADTARLLASLALDDSQFRAGARRAAGEVDKLGGRFSKIGGLAQKGLSNAITNIKRLALVGVGIVAANVTAGIQSLASIESAQAATQAALKSTRGVAGETFDTITARSQKWSDAIGVNEEDVQHLQNVLLTFTGIAGRNFDKATTAALDMSTALGQDAQQSAIQLGKALNDPVKGATALRRVGVQLSDEQIKRIKKLVAAGKLEAAQQVILNELQTEFGGQAKAAGETAQGQFNRFGQAVQAAQRALATAFLPVMLEVSTALREWLSDPKTLQGIKDFGQQGADLFRKMLDTAKRIPWGAIADGAKALARGAEGLLNAFLSLPSWVQTAVVTGWGLNKLTGGALSGIVGELGKGLIKGVLGINAAVVNVRGPVAGLPGGGAGKSVPVGPGAAGAAGAAGVGGVVIAAASITALGAAVTGAMVYGIPAAVKAIYGPGRGNEQQVIPVANGRPQTGTTSGFISGVLSSLTPTLVKVNTEQKNTTSALADIAPKVNAAQVEATAATTGALTDLKTASIAEQRTSTGRTTQATSVAGMVAAGGAITGGQVAASASRSAGSAAAAASSASATRIVDALWRTRTSVTVTANSVTGAQTTASRRSGSSSRNRDDNRIVAP